MNASLLSRRAATAAVLLVVSLPAWAAADAPPPDLFPFAHTYSIVARDSTTGEMGVAVQSHWFSVGAVVPWAEAGVGAVATQSMADASYGPLGLQMLKAGRAPEDALRGLLEADAGSRWRQVAILDARGRVAVHTGGSCIPAAGHRTGAGYSVQANLMASDAVWPAMSRAYETAPGDLAERLLAALEAAEAAGGDIRGRQSAAILVVRGEATGRPWEDRLIDLRVEDSDQPLVELRRLLAVHRAYRHMNAGDEAIARGDAEEARREYARAAELYPENLEIVYWQAVTLANAGLLEEALPIFARIFAADAHWRELTPRLRQVGLLEVGDEQMRRILEQR